MKYILRIDFPIDTFDDIEARLKAKQMLLDLDISDIKNVKLQRIENGKSPTGIDISGLNLEK